MTTHRRKEEEEKDNHRQRKRRRHEPSYTWFEGLTATYVTGSRRDLFHTIFYSTDLTASAFTDDANCAMRALEDALSTWKHGVLVNSRVDAIIHIRPETSSLIRGRSYLKGSFIKVLSQGMIPHDFLEYLRAQIRPRYFVAYQVRWHAASVHFPYAASMVASDGVMARAPLECSDWERPSPDDDKVNVKGGRIVEKPRNLCNPDWIRTRLGMDKNPSFLTTYCQFTCDGGFDVAWQDWDASRDGYDVPPGAVESELQHHRFKSYM